MREGFGKRLFKGLKTLVACLTGHVIGRQLVVHEKLFTFTNKCRRITRVQHGSFWTDDELGVDICATWIGATRICATRVARIIFGRTRITGIARVTRVFLGSTRVTGIARVLGCAGITRVARIFLCRTRIAGITRVLRGAWITRVFGSTRVTGVLGGTGVTRITGIFLGSTRIARVTGITRVLRSDVLQQLSLGPGNCRRI